MGEDERFFFYAAMGSTRAVEEFVVRHLLPQKAERRSLGKRAVFKE